MNHEKEIIFVARNEQMSVVWRCEDFKKKKTGWLVGNLLRNILNILIVWIKESQDSTNDYNKNVLEHEIQLKASEM